MYTAYMIFVIFCVISNVFGCLGGDGSGQIQTMCSNDVISGGLYSDCADCSFLDGTADLAEAVNALSDNAASILNCIPSEYSNVESCPMIVLDVLGPDSAIEVCQNLIGSLVDESLSDSDLINDDYGLNQVFDCSSENVLNKVLGNSLATMQNMLENPGTPCTLLVDYQNAVHSLINANCGLNCADDRVKRQIQIILEIIIDFLATTLELECGEYQTCVTNCGRTNGECVEEVTAVCNCQGGYEANSTYECVDVNECDESPCLNEATCMNSEGSFQCICPVGTFGNGINACSAADYCDGVVCENGGTCVNGLTDFECECEQGWEGLFCGDDVKECLDPMTCREGTCMEQQGSFFCECFPGYHGDNCEIDTNECEVSSPCHADAFCTNNEGSFQCTCDDGFAGTGFECSPIITYEICDPSFLPQNGRTRVSFSFPINFDGEYYQSLWITENGVLIFSDSATLSNSFDMQENEGLPYIAPFWDNYDLNNNVIWSLEEDLEGVDSCEVQNMIDRIFELKGIVFKPITVLQVYWDEISIFPISDYGGMPNSFQCNLLSDGFDTYLFFSYQPGEILFMPGDRNTMLNNAIIGFSNPDGINSVSNITRGFYLPDTQTNTGTLGEYLHMISAHENDDSIGSCLNWVNNEQKFPIETWFRPISCPWTLRFAVRDWRFSWIPVNRRSLNDLGVDLTDYPLTLPDYECFQSISFAGRAGVRCCYSSNGRFTAGPRTSHFQRRQVISGFPFPVTRIENSFNLYREVEIDGQKSCCADINSIYCFIYNIYRPSASQRFYRPIFPRVWGFGDPHITTLSNYVYTFNGLGEYVLLYISDGLQMQGRTEIQSDVDGTSSGATVFTRFALYVPESATNIQVLPEGPSSTNVNITFNGTLAEFNDNFGVPTYFSEDIQYTKTSNTTFQITINDSLSISFFSIVTSSNNVMSFTIRTGGDFNEDILGLLGDFIFPNGTSLSIPDITLSRSDILNGTFDEELIFPYGESWRVTEDESLFEYGVGEDYDMFNSPDHIPPFLTNVWDSASVDERTQATDLCDNSLSCIYDFLVTNDSSLAAETETIQTETEEEEVIANNNLPEITLPSQDSFVNGTLRFNVNEGPYASLMFTISDADDDDLTTSVDYQLTGISPSIDNSQLSLHWQGNASAVLNGNLTDDYLDISVSDGIVSVTLAIPIRICLCKNNGTCLWDNTVLGTSNYGVVACDCIQAYDGLTCEDDRDECSPNPCVGNCTDMPEPATGFTCGPCPEPLVLQGDGVTCSDPDQCADGIDDCSMNATCIDLPNGFRCGCGSGFELNNDNVSCSDVDECQQNNACPINSNCTNNAGSFICTCHSGFNQSDNCMNINECNSNPCTSNTTICVDTIGSFRCDCVDGHSRPAASAPTSECEDIDECSLATPVCAGSVCENSVGGFTCTCNDTYVRISATVCQAPTCGNILECPMLSECMQTDGGVEECVCINGRILFEDSCRRQFAFSQELDRPFRSEFRDLTSPEARAIIQEFENLMRAILQAIGRSLLIDILELLPGSTIVVFDLISNSTEDENIEQQDLLVELIEAIQSEQFNTSLFIETPAIRPVNTTGICDDLPPTSMTFEEILASGQAVISFACNPNSIGLTIDLCLLENAGLGGEDMVIGGPSQFPIDEADVEDDCRPRVVFTNDGDASALFLLFDLQVCNPDVTMDNETIEYSYHVGRIRNSPFDDSNVIQRILDVCANLTCTFNRSYEIWSDPIKPLIRKISFESEVADGEFDITIELFRDAACNNAFVEGGEVMVSDSIYFKVDHPGPNEDAFTLQASQCWATLNADPADEYRYDIIDNGCASTEDSGAIMVLNNFNDTFVKAGFESFVWTNVSNDLQKIYVHCMVGLCLPGMDCGQIECGMRKKREVNNDIEQHLITLGPLKPYDPCQGHCEQKCTLDADQPVCSCYEGYELSYNGITCYQTKLVNAVKESEQQSKDLFFYGVVIMISVLTSVLAVLIWKK